MINKLHITQITKTQGKYYIHIHKSTSFAGLNIFGFGHISISGSGDSIVTICEKEDKKNYDIITELIKKID